MEISAGFSRNCASDCSTTFHTRLYWLYWLTWAEPNWAWIALYTSCTGTPRSTALSRSTVTRSCWVAALKVLFMPVSSGRVARLCQKLLRELIEPPGLSRLLVLNPELKAARGADARNRRRRNGYEPALLVYRATARQPPMSTALAFCTFAVAQEP